MLVTSSLCERYDGADGKPQALHCVVWARCCQHCIAEAPACGTLNSNAARSPASSMGGSAALSTSTAACDALNHGIMKLTC